MPELDQCMLMADLRVEIHLLSPGQWHTASWLGDMIVDYTVQ